MKTIYRLRFEKYNVIRNDRNDINSGGGTAILIKKYNEITTPEIRKDILENTIIKFNNAKKNCT